MDFFYEPCGMYTPLRSLFVHDDIFESPPSPKRCDRGTQRETAHRSCSMAGSCREAGLAPPSYTGPPHAGSFASGRRTSLDELFLYCTEELGSESTSGAGHLLIATASSSSCSHDATATFSNGNSPTSSNTSTSFSNDAIEEPISPSLGNNYPLQSCSSHVLAAASEHHFHHRCNRHRHGRSVGFATAAAADAPTFPPPLLSLLCDRPLMRSFKTNGRFVLKKVANASRSLFRSIRKDGRLRLDLLSSPSDGGLDDQCFPKPAYSPPQFLLDPPSPIKWSFTMLTHKPTLSYETLPPQALAILMHSNIKCTCSPAVEEPKSAPSATIHITEFPATAETAASSPSRMPRVFALLSLFPVGLRLIIFEFGQSKLGAYVILHGVYIMKSLKLQCSNLGRDHFLTNLSGMGGNYKAPKGELFPIGYCKK